MTRLDNGQWLQQNGRIGQEGAKRLFSDSTYDDKLWEKRNKGYEEKNDPYPHHVEFGLNHFGLTSKGSNATPSSNVTEPVETEPVDDSKVKSILERIDTVIELLGDYVPEYNGDPELAKRQNYLEMVEEIRNNVENNHIFTPSDIRVMNEIYDQYYKEEETV